MTVKMSSSTQLPLALLLIILYYRTCDATECSSLCGGHNVSHPFRLKYYPDHCGDLSYNLSCEDNLLVLYFKSGKYYVQSINYGNYTIRLTDAIIAEYNYSSLPRYPLTDFNFSSGDPYSTPQMHAHKIYRRILLHENQLTKIMIFVSSKHPVNSSQYADIAPCLDASNASAASSSLYFYANIGSETLRDLGLEDGCRIEMMYMTSWPSAVSQHTTHSCTDIHNMLVYGFELSWLDSLCYNGGYLDQHNNLHCGDGGFRLVLVCAVKFVLGAPFVIVFLIYRWRRRHLSMYDNIEDFLQGDNNIMPIRYSYKDIKKMSEGFKIKLGNGGYGTVFRGKLRSGRLVAVKMLDKAKSNGQEFINEVATLGRIHHLNVVHLIGYCVEGSKRALVYEFMENGSLDKYIHSQEENDQPLKIDKLYAISLGVAHGIEYLHNGCDVQILHFDIKPHNILLDDNFNPKVSDFGLAKLYPTDYSIVSLTAARGTIGYMAPELFYRNVGGVSYKADVYSFGMLLMEMASRRKNLNALAEHSSQLYFPFWVYDRLHQGKEINTVNIGTDEEMTLAKKMMVVALWCIQTKPSDRPSMKKVIEMLEGKVEDMEMPRKPYLYPQDLPAMDVRDHASSTSSSSDPTVSDSKESVSLSAQEDDLSISSIS